MEILLMLTQPASVAVADGIVYAGFVWNARNWLVAIDGENGTELWRSEISRGTVEPSVGLPAVANGVVYVPTGGDRNDTQGLVAVDATDGHIRWRFSPNDMAVSFSPVALVGDNLYIVCNNHLYALTDR
ncbi:outer membrane protein assembly factor BamB family protein [Halocatena halophila]|uniref:outer membrane protein assembly factor BamB family protein n=1 Tax=Halocatena halophila TaxID=2814576 RepID=UPI0038B40959